MGMTIKAKPEWRRWPAARTCQIRSFGDVARHGSSAARARPPDHHLPPAPTMATKFDPQNAQNLVEIEKQCVPLRPSPRLG